MIKNMKFDELLDLDGQILSLEELDELEEHESVFSFENIGNSGRYPGKTWFAVGVKQANTNAEISVYH